jgi:ankyrin repeat protein
MEILASDPLALALKAAIQTGDIEKLEQLLQENPELSRARLVDEKKIGRTALHIATDWPGHFLRCAETIAALIRAGADPNAQVTGAGYHAETPLHGAASSDDVEALDALLDGGADIERGGAVFTNGAAMSDAVIFAQWKSARRLLERGAKTTLTQAAALGLMDRLSAYFDGESQPEAQEITAALWHACRGGQQEIAAYLLQRGADLNWIGWDHMTPLDTAIKSGNEHLVDWMRAQGAKSARELHPSGPR